jgi:hypothetical protein
VNISDAFTFKAHAVRAIHYGEKGTADTGAVSQPPTHDILVERALPILEPFRILLPMMILVERVWPTWEHLRSLPPMMILVERAWPTWEHYPMMFIIK